MKTTLLLLPLIATSFFNVNAQGVTDYSITEGLKHPFEVKHLDLHSEDSLNYLIDFPYLEKLTLSNWDDSIAPIEIGKLAYLKELRFTNDHFEVFPDSYKELKSLRKLELINDSIGNLKQVLNISKALPALEELRIEGISKQLFTSQLSFPNQISKLSLRNNHLEIIPTSILSLSNLKVLDLGKNDFLSLKGLDAFKQVNTLFLDHQKYPERILESFNKLHIKPLEVQFLPNQDELFDLQFAPPTKITDNSFLLEDSKYTDYRPNLQLHFLDDNLTQQTLESGKIKIRINKNN